jgi:hypothetical protein
VRSAGENHEGMEVWRLCLGVFWKWWLGRDLLVVMLVEGSEKWITKLWC